MNIKPLLVTASGVAALAVAVLTPASSSGQAGSDDAALSALLGDATAQQATITDNQAKIDAKLATITENLRVARIFVSRGGGKVP